MIGAIAVLVVSPASSISLRNDFEKGSGALAIAAMRCVAGTSSRMSSTILAEVSAVRPVLPVTFPPGRARLSANPVPIISPQNAQTIGISRVACLAAVAVGVNQVTITLTLRL